MIKAYDKATGRTPDLVKETEDPKLGLMRADWLRHPITADFLHYLNEEYIKLAEQLVDLAASGGDAATIQRIGARAKKLKEIINYARRD